jgi:hypothetical protein
MIDNSLIYKQVKRTRKEKRKENAAQNEHPGMLVKCLQCLVQQRRPNSSTSDEEEGPSESSSQTETSDIEESSSSPVQALAHDMSDLLPPPPSEQEAEATQEDPSPRTDLEYPIFVRQNIADEDVEVGQEA